jgi:peroxiredoxin 3
MASQSLVQKPAPDFNETAVLGGDFVQVNLADYKGKWVVLFFYPLDFTFVCPTEITAFDDELAQFKALGAEVIGVSVDSKFTHLAWANTPRKDGGIGLLKYPLVADISKRIATEYGVLVEPGIALRGLFIIDPDGKVAYQVVHDLGIGRSLAETLRVLKAVQFNREHGEVCPANWQPGQDSMKGDPNGSKEYFNKHG